MQPSDWVSWLAVAVVAVLVLASGPLAGGFLQPSAAPTIVGDGTASVGQVSVPTDELVVTPGRFGTDVAYLRVPDATVSLDSVTERPRLVYLVEVPALDVQLIATEIVTAPGSYRLHTGDRGLPATALDNGSYDATVTVRLQSFSTDRRLVHRNVTVEVRR